MGTRGCRPFGEEQVYVNHWRDYWSEVTLHLLRAVVSHRAPISELKGEVDIVEHQEVRPALSPRH